MNFLTLKPETFGLDITDSSLKIIKLKKKKKFLTLASFSKLSFDSGLIERGEIKDEKALIEAIKTVLTLVKGEKLKTKYSVVSLPEEKTFSQIIQLPRMKEEELKEAVYFEAENYIPLPLNEVYLDYQIVPPLYDHLDHLDVLIIALPKKIVDSYLLSCQKAGLKPLVLESESQAISRAVIKNNLSPQPLLVIDLGKKKTSLIIFSGHSLRFTSSLPISSQKFTEAISKALKVKLRKAEQLKIKYGLIKAKPEGKKIFEALIPVLTDLIEQMKKYLIYYQTHTGHEHLPPNGRGIKKVLLVGGGANLKGLTDFLAGELKLPVELGNPWINIFPLSSRGRPKLSKERPALSYQESLAYTTAFGLALRTIREND